MIVNDEEALTRINSPLNLMNRLESLRTKKKNDSLDIFINSTKKSDELRNSKDSNEAAEHSDESVNLDSIMNDADADIKLATAHRNAIDVMNSALNEMSIKITDIKPERLPAVVTAAGKIVSDIRRERIESQKSRTAQNVHFHFYTPEQRKLTDYNVIDVGSVSSANA